MKQFNINDIIKVKLTEHGRNMHAQNYKKYLGENFNKKYYLPAIDKEGFTKYQLWEFMNIFGEHMFNGAEQVIENNLIYFEEVHGREPGAKEPVRCKDCKHWERRECGSYGTCEERDGFFDADWFCADGLRWDEIG